MWSKKLESVLCFDDHFLKSQDIFKRKNYCNKKTIHAAQMDKKKQGPEQVTNKDYEKGRG